MGVTGGGPTLPCPVRSPPPAPPVFGLFKKSDPLSAARAKHAKLLAKAAEVSSARGVVAASAVHAEAAEVEREIVRLEAERAND